MKTKKIFGADSPLRCNIEDGELVIRVGVNRLDGNDCHPRLPKLKFDNINEWARDVINELEKEEEDGSSPLSDLLDKAMENAIEYGSMGLSLDSFTHVGECHECGDDCVPLRHTRRGQKCAKCITRQ